MSVRGSRERHKASSSKDSVRSERSVVINPPDTPSQDSPVHNGEALPGEPTPTGEQEDEAQVCYTELIMSFIPLGPVIRLQLEL